MSAGPSIDDASAAPGVPQLVFALQRVEQWRSNAGGELDKRKQALETELEETAARLQALEAELLEVRERHAELEGHLEEVSELSVGLQSEHDARTVAVVTDAVSRDRELVRERARVYEEAMEAREAELHELIEDPEVARLVEEFEQFVEVEPTLDLLPAGYRKAILSHHEAVRRRLQPVFDAVERELPPADVPGEAIAALAALAEDDGVPMALVMVLPARYAAYKEWASEGEGLEAHLAYRVVGAVSWALTRLQCGDAPMRFIELDGHLAMQVWLSEGEGPQGDVQEVLQEAFHRLRQTASELAAVGLTVHIAWTTPDVVEALEQSTEEVSGAQP